jgi:hypothetical protein
MKILGIHSRSLRKYVGALHVAITSVNVATKRILSNVSHAALSQVGLLRSIAAFP